MAKKVFLNRERAIPCAQAPSVSREEIASSSRNKHVSEQLPFMTLGETYPKFNTAEHSLLIKFNSPGEEQESTTYPRECITAFPGIGRGLLLLRKHPPTINFFGRKSMHQVLPFPIVC